MLQETKKLSIVLTSITVLFSTVIVPHALAEEIIISGNGAESVNQVTSSPSTQTNVSSNNNATVTNTIDVTANTGNNEASNNIGGSSTITTGNVTENVAAETIANTSNVSVDSCCNGPVSNIVSVSGNGSGSNNNVTHNNASQNNVTVQNTAIVINNVTNYANTGNNSASGNVGNVTIKTGSIFNKQTIHNSGVNNAHVSIALGTKDAIIKILNNGSYSYNNIDFSDKSNTDINVYNVSDILNNLRSILNTGNNTADDNVGKVAITTGDIDSIIAITNVTNISTVTVDCCKEDKEDPEKPNPNPSAPTPSSNTSSGGGSGSSSSSDTGAVLGAILPVTGNNFLLIGILGNVLLLIFGAYLRLHSGNSPGLQLAL